MGSDIVAALINLAVGALMGAAWTASIIHFGGL